MSEDLYPEFSFENIQEISQNIAQMVGSSERLVQEAQVAHQNNSRMAEVDDSEFEGEGFGLFDSISLIPLLVSRW